MSTRTASTVEGFRKPWTEGAAAYFEADTFAAAVEGFRRMRNNYIFHMPNTGEAGSRKCVGCGRKLSDVVEGSTKPDRWSTWTYSASRKRVGNGMHYACSWSNLFMRIFRAADEGKL